jgi:plastocyanin
MKRALPIALGAVFAAVAACGSSSTENGNPNNFPGDPGTAPVQAATVQIQDNFFNPSSVVLATGGSVTWHWVGGNGHSVTPTGSTTFSPTAPVSFPDRPDLVVSFPTAGTYNYFCTVHGASDGYGGAGSMVGTITVR